MRRWPLNPRPRQTRLIRHSRMRHPRPIRKQRQNPNPSSSSKAACRMAAQFLTRQQFAVTRQKATEPPFSGIYATGHFKGNFVCVDCDRAGFETVVFSAQHKFESGTGWPSFYRAASDRAIRTAPDYGGIEEPRIEVMCRRCGAHLGHVFDDGPPPTGLRFCINSIAIKLKSPNGDSRPRSAATKTTPKSTSKTKATASATSASKKTQPGGASRPAGSGRPPSGNQAQGDS